MTFGKEEKLYGELLSFLTIDLVYLSSRVNINLPTRTPLSNEIAGYSIAHTGLSNWDWVSGLLIELKVAKSGSNGLSIVCQNGREIADQFSANPRPDVISLEYMLKAFIDISCGLGEPINTLASKSFPIPLGYERIFQAFEKNDYVKKTAEGYLWMDKIAPAMIFNSIWYSHCSKIQCELETESQADREYRLNCMYNTIPDEIRNYFQENRHKGELYNTYDLCDKLVVSWDWKENKWGKPKGKTATWIAYRDYVEGLQKLIANQ